MKRAFVLSVGLLALSAAAGAEDLKAVYERALVNDPQIREADALRDEEKAIEAEVAIAGKRLNASQQKLTSAKIAHVDGVRQGKEKAQDVHRQNTKALEGGVPGR